MIKINLLPFRAARKKENIRRQISIYILSVICVFCMIGYFHIRINKTLNSVQAEKIQKTNELATYAQTTKKIKELETKKNQVNAKLNIIRGLEKNKAGPVKLLDEISMAVPKNRLWLSSFDQRGNTLSLKGIAKDNDTVALFMINLEKASQITSVDLTTSQLTTLQNYESSFVDFTLSCTTAVFKDEPKKQPRRPPGK
ncbi:MAG TPA: hypothetical protein ENN30_00380 [Candidatus Woesearchaeota archaeon]|nr:hypothetical protein [Candidatus Woesearchaeota archaeon]